jgi:2-dehydropantoate 2-reductase
LRVDFILGEKRTYAIIGAGAVGGFYGARLLRAGFDVHFLLHGDYEHVRIHGLRIESSEGDFALPKINAYRFASDMPPCDVAVLSLKTTNNRILPEVLPRILKDDGAVLVVQNGLGIEEDVAALVGGHRVMGGLCFLRSNKIGPGLLRHSGSGHIILGEYSPSGPAGITPRCEALADDFRAAGLVIVPTADLRVARWQKLVWNIPYNGLSVVLDATTDCLMKNPSTRSLILALMHEVEAGAAACGHSIQSTYAREMFDYTDAMEPYATSMKIDFDEKRPMEIESIYGNPLRAVAAAGASMPRVEMLYQQLKYLDGRGRHAALVFKRI